MFRIAICDDEAYFRRREKELIEKHMKKKRCACQIDLYSSGEEILNNEDSVLKYDMVFLDVSMEEMDGMKAAEKIRQINEMK